MSLVAPRREREAKKVKLEIDQHDRPLQFVSLVHGPDPFFAEVNFRGVIPFEIGSAESQARA